jgi:hypothetical protein
MKSTDYELLVREIYQQILDQDKVPNIVVEHDVFKRGLATEHQIDVYWEFSLGGCIHRVAVQAKQWAKRVDQGELLKFKAVLDDLPGTVGIVVTAEGYQKGALDVAATYGITICELKQETQPPIEVAPGDTCTLSIKGLRMAGEKPFALVMRHERVRREVSDAVFQSDLPPSGFAEPSLRIVQPNSRDVEFYNIEEKLLFTLEDIYAEMALELRNSNETQALMTRSFNEPTFLKVPSLSTSVKVKSLSAKITLRSEIQEREWKLENVAIFALNNLNDGTSLRFAQIP